MILFDLKTLKRIILYRIHMNSDNFNPLFCNIFFKYDILVILSQFSMILTDFFGCTDPQHLLF